MRSAHTDAARRKPEQSGEPGQLSPSRHTVTDEAVAPLVQHRDFAGHEIRSAARPDIDELLGAALRKREPCALHLNHHPVSGAERMRDVGHAERHAGRNARRKGFGAREPVAETPPHHVAAHEHPAAGLRIVVGKNVDQPDDKIGVGGRKDHLQLDIDGSREGHIPVERLGDEGQHIGTVRHEALVGEHILFGAAFAEGFDIGHRVGRIGRIGGGGAFGRRAAGFETSAVGEVEGELTRFARRPAVESMPAVVARRENRGGAGSGSAAPSPLR